jgi:16S rRNA (cytidine1402-2'-O)-methyltransferase
MPATLYLLPNRISDRPVEETLPAATLSILRQTRIFLAENAKSTRAFLKAASHPVPLIELQIDEIGHEPDSRLIDQWLSPLAEGKNIAIVSESGCPGIADPGATIVARAQEKGYSVKPLVGPSSILLALMASGLDGQHFRFLGYLPIKEPARTQALREAEHQSARGETQIFIETPYRNQSFLEFLCQTLQADTRITVACDITGEAELIRTKTALEWSEDPIDLPKLPTIFAILAVRKIKNAERKVKKELKSFGRRKQGSFWRQA